MTGSLPAVSAPVRDVIAEIKALRKGRGLYSGDLEVRVGPNLSELAVRDTGLSPPLLRQALTTEVSRYAANIASDLRIAILASLGVSAETKDLPLFGERVSWLAARLNCEYRTALRRIDTAERMLAEEVVRELLGRRDRATSASSGWRLAELTTLVRLDTPTPEILERRRIVSTQAGLKEVMAWTDLPPSSPERPRQGLSAEVLFGGRLVRRQQPGTGRFQFVVRLPEPLQAGHAHEYEMLFRIPPDQPMRPHYVFSPECECGTFELRVRFDPARPPSWVRRVDGETVRMLDSPGSGSSRLSPDDACELHLKFANPSMYLCYGVQWQP